MFKKILIYNSGGGIGDSILLIPLIRSIQDYFKTAKIYYLGSHKNHFDGKLKEYGVNIVFSGVSLDEIELALLELREIIE